MAKESRNDRRVVRHARIRKYLSGTPEKPRLCVFRSNKNIAAQIIDDVNGVTLVSKQSQRERSRRVSRKSALTEADSCITEELRNWLTAPAKRD